MGINRKVLDLYDSYSDLYENEKIEFHRGLTPEQSDAYIEMNKNVSNWYSKRNGVVLYSIATAVLFGGFLALSSDPVYAIATEKVIKRMHLANQIISGGGSIATLILLVKNMPRFRDITDKINELSDKYLALPHPE